jgi:hypothetical protein
VLELDTTGISSGKQGYKVLEEPQPKREREMRGGFSDLERPSQNRPVFKTVPYTEGGSVTTAVFNIRLFGRDELKGKASVLSTRGGVLKDKEFIIR